MAEAPGNQPPRWWEKSLLGLMALGLVVFMAWSEVRSCFLKQRHTDYTVYVRAAWAARVGEDMYQIADEHGWHYCYPPPFALMLTPLADPPKGVDRTGYVPFWFAAGVWIVISMGVAVWTVHALAKAVLPDAVPWTRRWIYARSIPFTLCLGGIGFTVSHGQVNTAVAALVAGMFAALVVGKRFTSGVWLAGAAALKITPAMLILYPLLHRDRRSLMGVVAGSVVLLILFPAMFFGFRGAVEENLKVVSQVLTPGVGGQGAGDQTRAKELTNTIATDSSSFVAVIHNWRNPQPHWHRPPDAAPSTRMAHWGISAFMVAVSAFMIWRNRTKGPAEQLMLLGGLMLVMVLASPVSHNHHFAMCLPALSGLWLWGLKQRPGQIAPRLWVFVPLVSWTVGTAILLFPGPLFLMLREFGLGTAVTVILWATCMTVANRREAAVEEVRAEPRILPRAA